MKINIFNATMTRLFLEGKNQKAHLKTSYGINGDQSNIYDAHKTACGSGITRVSKTLLR